MSISLPNSPEDMTRSLVSDNTVYMNVDAGAGSDIIGYVTTSGTIQASPGSGTVWVNYNPLPYDRHLLSQNFTSNPLKCGTLAYEFLTKELLVFDGVMQAYPDLSLTSVTDTRVCEYCKQVSVHKTSEGSLVDVAIDRLSKRFYMATAYTYKLFERDCVCGGYILEVY